MYEGDRSRKESLVEYGFRLPSALDNRPLKFPEFEERIGQVIYMSATPGPYEISQSAQVVEQIVRPTGLVDPKVSVSPTQNQMDDLVERIKERVKKGERVLVTTLTKRMAEDITDYLTDLGLRVSYLHYEVATLERVETIVGLRRGDFDVLVGINLLREGLDLPEVSFVGILDADKEGFLRSETSLTQTIGRASRNVSGEVILYADHVTGSMKKAIKETDRRRKVQEEYNRAHSITPETIKKAIKTFSLPKTEGYRRSDIQAELKIFEGNIEKLIKYRELEMKRQAQELNFEVAAIIRDEIAELKRLRREKKRGLDLGV